MIAEGEWERGIGTDPSGIAVGLIVGTVRPEIAAEVTTEVETGGGGDRKEAVFYVHTFLKSFFFFQCRIFILFWAS